MSPAVYASHVQESASVNATSRAMRGRYTDAYSVANGLVSSGTAIQVIGAVIGGLVFLFGLTQGGILGGIGGVMFGAVVAIIGYMMGVMVKAQGQILLAALDTAVNSCRFLDDEDRASIFGVPAPACNVVGA